MQTTEKACQMIEEIDWDQLLHENDIDCFATNWHNHAVYGSHVCLYPTTNPETEKKCAMAHKEYYSSYKEAECCIPSFQKI